MGEATLVRQDAYEGALLVERLDVKGLRLTAAFWAHDADLDTWRLVLTAPRDSAPSPRATYALIQKAINELDLSLPLDRVTFIADTAPLVGTLREFAAAASTDVVEVPLAGADIAGVSVDTAYAYRVEAILYEKDILAALHRVQPDETILHRAEGVLARDGFDFDFVVYNGLRMLLVVAKALPRRLSSKDVRRIVADYQDAAIRYVRAALMIISKTGFVAEPGLLPPFYEGVPGVDIMLVKWAGMEDDEELRTRLAQLFASQK